MIQTWSKSLSRSQILTLCCRELDVRRFFESGNTPVSSDLCFHDYNVASHIPSQQPPPIQREDGMSQVSL